MRRYLFLLLSIILLFGLPIQADADTIYVLGNTHSQVTNARTNLANLGHTVTFGGSTTLTDYSTYDQVWDLRYSVNLVSADITAMGNYLSGGGRMYLTGEHSGFDSSRNNSLVSWINAVGGGTLSLTGYAGYQQEYFTSSGQTFLNNNPNYFSAVQFNAARTTSSSGTGFLATEIPAGSGEGSLVGWDFGDITGAPDARMLVGFDIEIFQNGQNWTENMFTFLAEPSNPIPEPATMLLLGSGLIGLAGVGRKKFIK